ncbi:Protein-L-isoaspartate(D-aspartate) O-methyltransferase-like protein [Dinothrombium tinctorium]|uniref:protein-L-isoaspartate(D-aspartate) O-methyltransferase n=1 Tax=Dinothrombium tinctorium TaxID=1965070 RepID=A0A443RLQ2_9ACAR|nr:Protein-L-isoaspartate(D-aspartate) O-methyltransferase-like protein [Dinothrombium tinctorium]
MTLVDRANYCKHNPYQDRPQSIGFAVTISAPHMHAAKALDVGSGSGYLTACMAVMVGPKGKAIGIDHIPELVQMSIENIERDQPGLIKSGNIKMIGLNSIYLITSNSHSFVEVGDGRLGYPEEAKYDAIHVGAAAPTLPQQLIEQLKVGGRLIIPMGKEGGNQALEMIDKLADGTIKRESVMSVVYVPLTDKESQWPGR